MAYSVGESVSGVVSGVTDYGAFVRLDDGSGGMIHISKLSRDFVSNIHDYIKKGDEVTATVISNDKGKIGLSLLPPKEEKIDFEAMLASFKTISDEKLSGMNSRNKKKRR